MKLRGTMKIEGNGHLSIGGCDVTDLKKEFGTPLVVIDENYLREICRAYYKNFVEKSKGKAMVHYASKAFLALSICKIMEEEGLGLDVVSGGELYTAHKANFPMERILFHGNNKSEEELQLALDLGVGVIVVDNFYELHFLNEIAERKGVKPDVFLRITPGIDAHTHEFIRTGSIDSKFGFTLANGDALKGVKEAVASSNMNFIGLHCHIGSQIFDMESFAFAGEVMMKLIKEIEIEVGVKVPHLDLGGGFGIYYTTEDDPESIEKYSEVLFGALDEQAKVFGLELPIIHIEPGRSIAGPAGTNLYTVGADKEIPGIRKYIGIDGGMADNIRPALYGAKYEVALGNRMNDPVEEKVHVTGKCCESSDILAYDADLPKARAGDILVMPSTGAYGYSMASNYNFLPRPAVILVKDGKGRIIIERESYDDLIKNHRL